MTSTEFSTQAALRLTGETVRRPLQTPEEAQAGVDAERTTAPDTRAAEPLSTKDLSSAVDHINELVQQIHRELRFSVDDSSGRVVIKVLDSETEEVLRQIPPEQVMSLVQTLQSAGGSLGVDVTA